MADESTRQMYFETWPRPTPIPDPQTGLDPTYRYAISTGRLRYDAVEHVLHLPDGVQCHYGQAGTGALRYVTSCADAFGPFLSVSYPPGTGGWLSDGITRVRHILTGSVEVPLQYREIELESTGPETNRTRHVRYDGRQWTSVSSATMASLETPGMSAPWTFERQMHHTTVEPSYGVRLLTKVITPRGGEIAYQYQERLTTVGVPPIDVSHGWFLASRTVSGPDIPSGTWTFDQFEFQDPFDKAPITFRLQAPAAGAGAGVSTTYWNGRASENIPGGALVGPGWVNYEQSTATRHRQTTFTDLVLVDGQAHAMRQVVPGYDPRTAPAIALPAAQHRMVPKISGPYTGSARDLLAADIRNLRKFTEAPNSSLQELIQLNKAMYPGAFAK